MEQSLIIKKKYLQEGFELSGWVELVEICQLFDQSKNEISKPIESLKRLSKKNLLPWNA